ncbi:sh3 domain protein [Diplodia corticola]|uniref:Sh3 domain protein n=1 Tax=Diplodia corticola TaxID=236234 RepID=A0A1J9RDR0_9PEZI|nr:sh3 domain protein [Diplodia corticola]OJD30691.1 sh3 domain protein [Diplodia corticola]
MTRPTIIRADTIDLQDPGSPSAADHSRQPTQPAPLGAGPASPHQAAAIRHVEEDRANEEDGLVQQWNNPSGGNHDDQSGTDSADVTDDGDMADSETEDMDDDMLDKISSSPSIDDGRYSLRSSAPRASAWPTRSSSLYALPLPATPPQQHMYQHSNVSPEPEQDSSSPFTLTPQHLPLSYQPKRQSTPRFGTPLSSSPFNTSPSHQPVRMPTCHGRVSSADHHRLGEYTTTGPTTSDTTYNPFGDEFEHGLESCYHEDTDFYADELSGDVGPLRSEQYELESHEDYFGGDWEDDMLVFPAGRPLPPIPVSDSANNLRELLVPHQSISSLEREYSMGAMSWETDSNASSYDPGDNDNNDDDDDDDDLKDTFLSLDDDRHDSAYGGECLRETEDIDFEFVYALHTFVATVEGQANATKGDTMVLLDDSNSYWWLVRIVKDSSIGYLPAEHIETPTERLARLNKHRNIDLSAAMLGDSAEKSKNPLKKAMRRRNAKTVQFTAPTYVEASDYDFSSDEEDDDGEDFDSGPVHIEDTQEHEGDDGRETMTVEPLRIGGKDKKGDEAGEGNSDELKTGDDKARTSDEIFDRAPEQKISRNGTVRNTDSFFKDESVETRKITLTPNLLRDDSSASTVRSETRERGGSLDSLEKELKSPDKPKDDKKKKEKKPGMLRGLFGRKDKKAKSADNEQNDEKQSEELTRESLSRDSEETASPKESAKAENESSQQQQQPVRQTAKASKSSEKKTNGPQKSQPSDPTVQPAKSILQKSASQGAAEATMRLVSAGSERNQQEEQEDSEAAARAQGQAQAQAELQARAREEALYQAREAEKEAGRNRSGSTSAKQAISNILHSKSNEREQKQESKMQKQENKMPPREKVKKSKERAPLDDFDSTPEWEHGDPFADPGEDERQPNGTQQQEQGLRPEDTNSPGDVSPIDMDQPPALVHDTSSQEEPDISPVSPSGSPLRGELSNSSPNTMRPTFTPSALNTNIPPASANSPMTGEPPSAASLPAWSDASLRSYLDDGSDIRDMLVVVKDTSGVVPVGADHPIMAGLFSDERSKVAAMGMQLDSLLGDWLSRKRRRNEGGRKQSC